LMGSLFGGKVPAILNALASFAGIKSASASSLLGMVGPLVMGVLGKKIAGSGLNVSGLVNLLQGEKSSILGALPGGMSAVMGLASNLGGGASQVETPTTGGTRWLLPLLLLLGLGGGIIYYMKNCTKPATPVVKVPEMPKVDTLAAKATEAIANFAKKLGSGFELKGNKDGIESQLVAFIEDAAKPVDKTTWFNFDRLLFQTGSAQIDIEKSKDQLTNMVEILKAFPKVKLKIGGYTDNVGNEAANMKLSGNRATAVLNYLVEQGIDKARLAAEGYGPQHPVADNATEEGRAQNRRVAVRVTEK
jgi:OmpA-OmpF porin, OOP family